MKTSINNLKCVVSVLFTSLIVFGMFSSVYANTVPVSDRTPQVRDAIVAAIPNVSSADEVTNVHLATITRLNLRAAGISKLKRGDFSGLTTLTTLNLYDNALSSLPDRIFEGLTALTTLRLGKNAIDPLPLIVTLQQVSESMFQAVIPTGAPSDIVLPINVTNGSISNSATMITISKGSIKSDTFTVVPMTDTSTPPIVRIGALPRLPANHYGYTFARSTACTRTLQVQEAITAAVPGITDCRDVTDEHLKTIQTLDLQNRGISTLRSEDFLGLPSLKNLYLSGNQLTSLPTDVFSELSNLESLHLHQNRLNNLPADIFSGLSSLTHLYLHNNQLTELNADVFSELPSLAYLLLNNNRLTSLSPNVFRGLSALTLLFLYSNTTNPLSLTVSLEKVGENRFKVTVPAGAPFDITLSLSVTNGNIIGSAEDMTIAAGNVESDPFTVTRTPGTLDSVTVDIKVLSSLPIFHLGYEVVSSEDLPLEVLGSINRAPVFTEGSNTTRSIAENTAAGVKIGSAVSATDANEDTLTYRLGGTDAAAFAIDTGSGQLRTNATLDYEAKNAYLVTVTVSDGNLTDIISVTIEVTDEDEVPTTEVTDEDEVPATEVTDEDEVQATDDPVPPKGSTPGNSAPVFVDGTSTTRSVPENTGSGVNIKNVVSATDADGDTLIYSLGGTDATSFGIDSTTGQLRTSAALDYETKNTYSVTVTVSDGNLTDTISVTIEVTDEDEVPATEVTDEDEVQATDDPVPPKGSTPGNSAPVFVDGTSTTRSVPENTGSGVNIKNVVSATDADGDTLIYSLGGTDATSFSIDSTTGQLRTSAALDYETKNTYSVTVTVSDGNLTDTISVTIEVTDEDEVPATEVTDEDEVQATDDPVPPKGTTPGNSAPVFVDDTSTTRSVPENTGSGVNIKNVVSATDADGDTLIYSLGGTDATSFNIDSTTGQLRTSAALDYETKNAYSVTVTVSDGNLTDTISVTIEVTDEDEVPATEVTDEDEVQTTDDPVPPKGSAPGNSAPVFVDGTSTTRSVPENTGSGVNIKNVVSATDADGDTLIYSLGGTDATSFSIDSTTGQLRTSAALDYETKSSYSVTVTVSDGNLTSTITVIINVSDIDEPSQTDEDPPQTDEDPPQTNLSEDVWMPDVHLRFAVRTALDIGSEALTQTKMLELTSLTAQKALISNLKGLEYAKNLTHLDVASNQITSISVLQGLTKLVHINIEDNQVTDISALTHLTKLQYIYVAGNPITDLSPMGNRPILGASWPVVTSKNSPEVRIFDANLAAAIRKALRLADDASITESDMEQLISLTATNAKIDSLRGLQYAKNLTSLDLSNNEIWSVSQITGLRKLTHLNLSNNKIDFVYGLHWIISLKELKLTGNPIDIKDAASLLVLKSLSVAIDIKLPTLVNVPDRALAKILRSTLSIPIRIPITKEVLKTMTSLENNYIREGYKQGAEEIEDLTGLEHATAMTTLSLPYHDVSNIKALQNLTQLTSLDLRNNYEISDYKPLSGLTNLTSLNLVNTYISDIKFLSGLTKLTELNIGVDFYGTLFGESELSDISSLANLTELTSLKLGETKVSDISDLSGLTKLTTLSLRKTKVRSISTLSKLTKLEILLLYGNKIVDISPLTGLTNLSYLTLDENPVVNTLPLCPLLRANGGNLVYVDIEVTNCPPPPNNAPVFTEGTSTTRSVAENTTSGTHIGTVVTATDADTDDTLTYSLGGTDAATFEIDATDGQLKTKASLDYETKSTYTVTVSVSDSNEGSDSITVTINVTNVNEAPVFSDGSSTTRSVAENTASGTNIGTAISATDVDSGNTLTYTLGGTDADSFSIVSTSGQLQTSAALNYETKTSYSVTVSVSDGNGGSDSITVTINVTNVNEAPVFTDGDSTTRSVAENTASGQNIGTAISATDVDSGNTLTYTLGGTDADSFSIVSTSGQLQTNAALDYEEKKSYEVSVSVSDGNEGTDSIDVTISVTDVDEAGNDPPTFTHGTSTTRSVAENTASGTNIGTAVAATDSDSDDTLTYTLGGPDADSFSIVSTSGQLQTNAALDYETKKSYTVSVSVSDGNGESDSITVTINVTDVNETGATVSTNITTCSVSHKSGNVYDVTIAGTVTGNRNVRFLIVHGYVNDDPDEIGRDSVGFLDAGETKNFSITGTWTHDGSTSQECSVVLTYQSLSAPSAQSLPAKTALLSNYPNPFNPETWIPYQLGKSAEVTITIYDVRGRVVRTLILGHQAAGVYRSRSKAAHWDGKNEFGEAVASGVYFYRFTAGDFSATRKMLIRK